MLARGLTHEGEDASKQHARPRSRLANWRWLSRNVSSAGKKPLLHSGDGPLQNAGAIMLSARDLFEAAQGGDLVI